MLGFSAHRAGICTVAAVGEVLTSRTARTFLSFLKVVAWILLINSLASLFLPDQIQPYVSQALSLSIVAGGFIFGIGAAINGGCSFSTISKLAQGELHVALTLPAFIVGALSSRLLSLPYGETSIDFALKSPELPPLPLAFLTLWGLLELGRLSLSGIRNGLYTTVTRQRYRLSSTAALIGICAGLLYLLQGRWAYSSRLLESLSNPAAPSFVGSDAFYLLLATVFGALASAVSNRTFAIKFAADKWHRNILGGYLMGFGAALVPGGNGKLMLQDLPNLAVSAGAAYLALALGIAFTLIIQMRVFGQVEVISCSGDECKVINT
ncbi:MAG: YeeE/YedE thiosulfate transporter family protein [Halioglobus sp.]